MTARNRDDSRWLPAFVIFVKLAILLLAGARYGWMSDELYFLDASRHLAAGYVDFPPLIAWLYAALSAVGLDSLFAVRAVAAVIGIGITLLGVDLCRALGGGGFARWLTALVMLFAPGFLSVQSILTMNVLDQFWWLAAFRATAGWLRGGNDRSLLVLGVVLGLGILTKLSIAGLCVALPLAFAIQDRRVFARPAAWIAVLLAIGIASPFLVWQVANDYPFLDFVAAYNSQPPKAMVLQYPLLGMLLTMNPAYALIWGPGAIYCLTGNRNLRVLGTAAWLCLALFIYAGVKFYFAVPVFALFTVAGALFWERTFAVSERRWVRVALILLGLSGVSSVPIAAPVLPPARLQQLANFLRDGEQGYHSDEPAELERYFPHFAEMHGWPELVAEVAGIWQALPEAERRDAVLFASFYGQSAALNELDTADVLPEAYGRHMSYDLWNRDLDFQRGLFVGFDASELQPLFERVELRGQFRCRMCMSREQGLKIWFVEGPRLPADEIRRRLRRYDFF